MTPIAKKMWNTLNTWLTVCQKTVLTKPTPIRPFLITYGDLVDTAGLSGFITPEGTGPYLKEIAEKCRDEKLPPLNALVVNKQSHIPGDAYDGAGGFTLVHWPVDVLDVMKCTSYQRIQ